MLVELEKREVLGKGLTRLRDDGKVPAVIHDHGKESLHVQGDFVELTKLFAAAGRHHPVDVKVGGKEYLALIKDVDFEPTKNRIRHVVFQAIKRGESVEAEIPVVVLEGAEIPAERKSLMVLRHLDYVHVKAKPKDLPDELVVDPSSLADVGDTLTVADIQVPAGVEFLTDPSSALFTVEMPKDQIAEADAAAAELAEGADRPVEPEAEETTEEATEEALEEKQANTEEE